MLHAGWFVVRRAFAPRRLYGEKELMALLVVVNMGVSSHLDRLAAHKLMILAGGIRWQRWQWWYGSVRDKSEKAGIRRTKSTTSHHHHIIIKRHHKETYGDIIRRR